MQELCSRAGPPNKAEKTLAKAPTGTRGGRAMLRIAEGIRQPQNPTKDAAYRWGFPEEKTLSPHRLDDKTPVEFVGVDKLNG